MSGRSLLIRDIHTLAAMDQSHTVLRGASLYIEDGEIRQVLEAGARPPKADRVIDGRHAVAIPGLVNTHHHLYQTLTRAYGPAADAELFDWLRTLYPIWARLDEESVHTAALAGMAELLLSGCTTTTDHHYVFPRGHGELIDVEIEAARRIGIRFHPTRGSMSVGKKQGGLPPDSVVQSEDRILADCERVIAQVSRSGAGGHVAHRAGAVLAVFGVAGADAGQRGPGAAARRPPAHAPGGDPRRRGLLPGAFRQAADRPAGRCRMAGGDTWLAHGIWFNRGEIARLGRAGVGIAHCPTSNMRLGSGCAPVLALRRAGCPVGLGVDGSASNDSSHMLAEARQALLLQRLRHGAAALGVRDALRMATVEGARCLGRDDIGTLEPGKRADIALFDLRGLGYSGAGDAVSALLLCAPAGVETLVIDGRIVVEGGELRTLRLDPLIARHRRLAAKLVVSDL